MRNFAKRLIVYEAGGNKSWEKNGSGDLLVGEKLRPPLSRLMGNGGFRALLSRALVLANAEVPWLRSVHVRPDGSLEGFEELHSQLGADKFLEGRVVLLAQVLGLLVAFIGETLTVHLVRDVWPKIPLNDLNLGNGGNYENKK